MKNFEAEKWGMEKDTCRMLVAHPARRQAEISG